MSKHTPGPWSIGHNPSIVIDPRENYVARCDQSSVIEDEAEIAANARLIAAAPEMYETLKALCSWITDEVEIDGCEVPTYAARLKAAQRAIAKAEGKP